MNGATLYILCTNLLGGNDMDETLFYQLLNQAKNQRELMRDWVRLRTYDTSITFSSTDTYLTGKNLPDRFLRTYDITSIDDDSSAVTIVRSDGSKLPLKPIQMAQRYDYRNSEGFYYIDHKNGTISRTGSTAGTLHLNYLQGSEDIEADTEWELSSIGGPLLVYDVVIEEKGGIDWDRVNASQVPFNERKLQQLEMNMATEDARLQQAELGV